MSQPAAVIDAMLVLGTGNRKKAAELIDLLLPLGLGCRLLTDFDRVPAVDETGQSFAENAALKATRSAAHLGRWVLGDDSGLVVDALDGAPGVYSARYSGPAATDADNRQRLLAALKEIHPARRTAHFECHLALADPAGSIVATSTGRCAGRIRSEAAGQGGFGYDPLFEVVEYHRTFAELSPVVKGCLSHRARAVYAVRPRIEEILASGEWGRRG